MSTWIVHLRIADEFIDRGLVPDTYMTEFIVGSVAPDCGYGEKDSLGQFTPPPTVTHYTPSGVKLFCEYDKFFDIYLKDKPKDDKYFFCLGYYIHLITDTLWAASIHMSTQMKFYKECQENPLYIKVIKKDWADMDFKYLQEHPDMRSYHILKNNTYVKDYLPYYEKGQLTVQSKFIADSYDGFMDKTIHYPFKHIDEKQVDEFVNIAVEMIEKKYTSAQ